MLRNSMDRRQGDTAASTRDRGQVTLENGTCKTADKFLTALRMWAERTLKGNAGVKLTNPRYEVVNRTATEVPVSLTPVVRAPTEDPVVSSPSTAIVQPASEKLEEKSVIASELRQASPAEVPVTFTSDVRTSTEDPVVSSCTTAIVQPASEKSVEKSVGSVIASDSRQAPADRSEAPASCGVKLSICLECDTVLETSATYLEHRCNSLPFIPCVPAPVKQRPVQHDGRKRRGRPPQDPAIAAAPAVHGIAVYTVDSENGHYYCPDCRSFSNMRSRESLAAHRIRHHCLLPSDLPSAMLRVAGRCTLCASDEASLEEHAVDKHGADGRARTCLVCLRLVGDARALQRHMWTAHGLDSHLSVDGAPPDGAAEPWASASRMTTKCLECGTYFADLQDLTEHEEREHRTGLVPLARLNVLASLMDDLHIAAQRGFTTQEKKKK